MWFWSVYFADQLSSQFLNFFGLAKKKGPVPETRHFFVHSLELFFRSFLKIGHSLISRLEKKIKRGDKI